MPEESPDAPTTTQIQKTLLAFIEETRNSFSALNSDREADVQLIHTINQNVTALEGKVENLSHQVTSLKSSTNHDTSRLVKKVEDKVEEVKEAVLPKKFIVKEVPHFSFKLWFKNLFKIK